MERLLMNQKELRRVGILASVKAAQLSLVEALVVLWISFRQTCEFDEGIKTRMTSVWCTVCAVLLACGASAPLCGSTSRPSLLWL